MKKIQLHHGVATFLMLGAALFAISAQAEWRAQLSVPLQTQTQTYSSSTFYGAPGATWSSTQQIPQTICQPHWVNGDLRQSCTTQFITIPSNDYGYTGPIYSPPPVYIVPGYGYNPYRPQNGHVPRYPSGHGHHGNRGPRSGLSIELNGR